MTRRFGRQKALDDVSLHVRTGDCYGFLGHNGAGKTTAMRLLLGLSRPDGGRVIVDGFDALRHPREARARLGGLIEVPRFHGTWSGRRNLDVLARLQGMSAGEARKECARVLDLVGLADVGSKKVRAYSQGMRQRLGIAQALLGDPSYVLLDEPTNGLDPEGISELRSMIARLRQGGTTVLVSSHQLSEVAEMCNRVGVIKQGRMIVEAPIEELVGEAGDGYAVRVGDAAAATSALDALGVEARRDGEELVLRLGGREPEAVASALVEAGAGLASFAPLRPSLEEVYLRCGADDGEATRPAAAPGEPMPEVGVPRESRAPSFPVFRAFAYDVRRWTGHRVAWLLALPGVLAINGVHDRLVEHQADLKDIEEQGLFSATTVTGFEALGRGIAAGMPLLTFLAVGLACQAIAGELGQGTLRNVLLRPVSRVQVAFGKAASTLAAVLLGYAFLWLGAYGAARYWFDFNDVAEILPNGQAIVSLEAEELWREVWPLTWAPLLPLAAYAGIGYCIGATARRATVALIVTLLATAFLDVGRTVARSYDFEAWLPSAYLPSPLGDTSYVAYYIDASTGAANASFEFVETHLSHPGAIAAAFFALAAFILTRRSVS